MSAYAFFEQYFLLFIFYSLIGWLMESVYVSVGKSVKSKKIQFVNRGFLKGPVVPIYGVSCVVMALTLQPVSEHWYWVALLGMVVCSAVEYFTSYIMEKLFHARWWDYTGYFLNLNGRICLKNSLQWAALSVLFIKLVHPLVLQLYASLPDTLRVIFLYVSLFLFLFDLTATVLLLVNVRKMQKKLIALLKTAADAGAQNVQKTKEGLAEARDNMRSDVENYRISGENFLQSLAEYRDQLKTFPAWQRKRFRALQRNVRPVRIMFKESGLPEGGLSALQELLPENLSTELSLLRMELAEIFVPSPREKY